MTYPELRRIYYQEAVARENLPVFMTVDRVSAPLADQKIANGQAFFIDGVSHYQNYHGDYARTIFVDEPTPSMKRAAAAVTLGWDSVRERLRPGLRYSEIYAMGQEAVRKGGYDFSIGFGPHSVGLSHTDEPAIDSGGFYTKDDLILQENMILSVDCPILDTGLGGSAHLEDLMLITHDGAEPIHSMSSSIIIV
jgi:Xaa-Pro aminopeptidase